MSTSGNETKTETAPPSTVIVPPVPGPYDEKDVSTYAWKEMSFRTESETDVASDGSSNVSSVATKRKDTSVTTISAGEITITRSQHDSHIPVQIQIPKAPCGGCGGAKAGGASSLVDLMPALAALFGKFFGGGGDQAPEPTSAEYEVPTHNVPDGH